MRAIIDNHIEEIRDLCRKHYVHRLFVFGSVLREDFNPATSDIDLLVEFHKDFPSGWARNYFDLQEELAKIFNRPVDLLSLGPIRNPYLRAEIQATQELLYAA